MMPALFVLLASAAAVAQSPSDVAQCAAIAADAERLACYDHLFAHRTEQSQSRPTPTAPATAPATAASSAAAGAAAASKPAANVPVASTAHDDFGLDGRPPPGQKEKKGPDEMQARIAEVVTEARGEYLLTLDNGQVWQQKEADWHLAFNVGDEVIIKRGTLKSYRLQLKGNNRATPVTRIR